MRINFYELDEIEDTKLEFAVIFTVFESKYVFVRHRDRSTWEIPGGHREFGEEIGETGIRELREETGITEFSMIPICDYSVEADNNRSYGRLFFCNAKEISNFLEHEIEEVKLFDECPLNLTYPEIQPYLFIEINKRIKLN